MTSLASNESSGWSQGDETPQRSLTTSPAGDTPPRPPRSPAAGAEKLWYYAGARRRLDPELQDREAGSPYGAAAATLRGRARPTTAATTNTVVRFEVVSTSAALTKTIAALRAEANKRAEQQRQRSLTALQSSRARQLSFGASLVTGEAVPGAPQSESMGRLVTVLSECDGTQTQQPRSPALRSVHRSRGSYSAASTVVLPPQVPSAERRSASARPPLHRHLIALTQQWVAQEEEEEEGREASARDGAVPMPPHPSLARHGATLVRDSCVTRLRRGKFQPPRPASAGVVRTAAPAPPPRPSSASTLKTRMTAEPVSSFRVLADATVPPAELYPSTQIPLLSSSRLRRANLESLRHNFDHQRYALHNELEDAVEWRARCQSAVLRRRSVMTTPMPPASQQRATSEESSVQPSDVPRCTQLEPPAVYNGLLSEVFTRRSHPAAAGPMRVSGGGLAFRSVWPREAARLAVEREQQRLVGLLSGFVVPCDAAALTMAATEELRAETIWRVRHPEEGAPWRSGALLFYREDFLRFVQARYSVRLASLPGTKRVSVPEDILDALPSKAESLLARYAYEVLPSVSQL